MAGVLWIPLKWDATLRIIWRRRLIGGRKLPVLSMVSFQDAPICSKFELTIGLVLVFGLTPSRSSVGRVLPMLLPRREWVTSPLTVSSSLGLNHSTMDPLWRSIASKWHHSLPLNLNYLLPPLCHHRCLQRDPLNPFKESKRLRWKKVKHQICLQWICVWLRMSLFN